MRGMGHAARVGKRKNIKSLIREVRRKNTSWQAVCTNGI